MKIARLAGLSVRRPKQNEIVIFDAFSERHFRPLIGDLQPAVLDTSLQRINIWVALASLRFGLPNLRNYTCAFIMLTRARLVLTTIDNSPVIYQIKGALPHVHILVVQNGRRSTFGKAPFTSFTDELERSAKVRPNSVDYYFTFGSTEETQFRNFINAEFKPIGSLKNNYLSEGATTIESNVLTFISSFPNFDNDEFASVEREDTYLFFAGQAISYNQYFKAERIVAQWLADFCSINKLKFQIAGKRSKHTHQEEAFFRQHVRGDWTFVPCNSESDSYRALLKSHYVASVDSSLAYEMFGCGKRTMFFTIRSEFTSTPGLMCTRFGYPALTDSSGPMWTNGYDLHDFTRIANYVTTCSDLEWQETVQTYSPIVMHFDPLNSQLSETIAQVLERKQRDETKVRASIEEVYG